MYIVDPDGKIDGMKWQVSLIGDEEDDDNDDEDDQSKQPWKSMCCLFFFFFLALPPSLSFPPYRCTVPLSFPSSFSCFVISEPQGT